jgi:hypothetical protein
MDPEFLRVVRDNLHSLGYQNLSDSLVEEFATRLQDEGTHITWPSPRSHQRERPEEQVPKSSGPDSAGEPERVESPRTAPKGLRKSPRKAAAEDDKDEVGEWSRRLKTIQAKTRGLDSQIQECRSAIIGPSADEPSYKDVPLYYGTSERGLDPYPAVSRRVSGGGGFIRPPPARAGRKPAGQRLRKGRRLLYEERFPDYVPPPERRRDELRWRIRQQLEYSDPRYHQ